MSREIRLRVWDKENKRICKVIGLWPCDDGSVAIQSVHEPSGTIILHTGTPPSRFILEQYTGLKDAEGKEIYAGDIVEVTDTNGKTGSSEVVWSDGGFMLNLNDQFGPYAYFPYIGELGQEAVKVVGTIHDEKEVK